MTVQKQNKTEKKQKLETDPNDEDQKTWKRTVTYNI